MNLTAQPSELPVSGTWAVPVSIKIRPACGLPGEHSFTSDSHSLLQMLKQHTDLPSPVLDRFMQELRSLANARLWGVELGDRTLRNIGYFVD